MAILRTHGLSIRSEARDRILLYLGILYPHGELFDLSLNVHDEWPTYSLILRMRTLTSNIEIVMTPRYTLPNTAMIKISITLSDGARIYQMHRQLSGYIDS